MTLDHTLADLEAFLLFFFVMGALHPRTAFVIASVAFAWRFFGEGWVR